MIAALLVAALAAVAPPAASGPPAGFYAPFDTVLARHVRGDRVDYRALADDRAPLVRFLSACERVDPAHWTRAERLVFWVNVYNARVLEGVILRPGLRSVRDQPPRGAPGFFAAERLTAGRLISLDAIERDVLRAGFREPRVHFVLNCASASCPPLPPRALRAGGLERTLETATARFLADRARNRIDPDSALGLSAVFDWYAEDFRAANGSVEAFVRAHWPGPGRVAAGLPVRFLDYDWSLNGRW